MKIIAWISSIVFVILLQACNKPKVYPVEPVIEFKNFAAMNDSGRIIFSFTDGDGDLGLTDSETEPPYDNNIRVKYFEKVNGVWVQPSAGGLPVNFDCRTQVHTPAGKNKALKGEMIVYLVPYYYNFTSTESDTIKYEIQMVDRALHVSNVVESGEIVR